MLNSCIIQGRIVRDIELRKTGSGISCASFTIACDRDFAKDGGERETDFIDIVCWRQTADFVAKYLGKSRMVVVDGRLQIRNWKDKDGNNRRTAEIIANSVYFADSKPNGQQSSQPANDFAPVEIDDDNLPW